MTKEYFIDKVVMEDMRNDLMRIYNIRISGSGNAHFPLAMLIIMYMSQLGSYLLGKDSGLEKNIREYLKCFSNPENYPPELLNDLFRNGLAHDYFARGAISRSKLNPPMGRISGVGVILDADSLYQDFIVSLDKFKTLLSEENFIRRFGEAKTEMEKRYEKHKSIIEKLPIIPLSVTIYPKLFISNTSGTAIYSTDTENDK